MSRTFGVYGPAHPWLGELGDYPAVPIFKRLAEILGPPIPVKEMWNPDVVLNVEDIQHAQINRERLDKAPTTQRLFEDLLAHIAGHLIQSTGSPIVQTPAQAIEALKRRSTP